jgi:hypothetical protein
VELEKKTTTAFNSKFFFLFISIQGQAITYGNTQNKTQ